MIKLTKTYKNALQKYGTTGVLNMYRDSKISLNKKEWDNLHKKIDKENQKYFGIDTRTIAVFASCLVVILIVSIFANVDNHEKIKRCNELKGHTCSRYEIESMGD